MVGFIKNMGQEIPLQTRILIQVSAFFVSYWWALVVTPVIFFAGIRFAAQTVPGVRYQLDRFKLGIPLLGPILRKSYCRALPALSR